MKKNIILLLFCLIFGAINAAKAEIGYIDDVYILENYPLSQKYSENLKTKADEIRTYAKNKDEEIEKLQTEEKKEKTKQEGIKQVAAKQEEYKNLKNKYQTELNKKIQTASEQVRVQKKLDIIIRKQNRVTGGVDCTQDVLKALKTQ